MTLRKTGWAQRSYLLRIRVETRSLSRNLGPLSSTALGRDPSLGRPVVPALSVCLLQLAPQKCLTYHVVCAHAIPPTWTAFLWCHPLSSSPS